MKFFNRSSYPTVKFSPSGSKVIEEYGLERDSEGNERLVVIGQKPIYEIIQASAEGAAISNIITRWRSGDDSVLHVSEGFYADITEIPSSLSEAHSALIKAQNTFNSLPLEVREQFGMNLGRFLSHVSDPNFSFKPDPDPVSQPSSDPLIVPTPPEFIEVSGVSYKINKEVVNNES